MTFSYDASGNLLTKTETDTPPGGSQRSSASARPLRSRKMVAATLSASMSLIEFGGRTMTPSLIGQSCASFGGLGARPLTVVDPNGVATTLAYDRRGRVTSMTKAGAITSFAYDPAGNIAQITRPDGSFLAYTYDARRSW